MKARPELHKYWRNPTKENQPDKYLTTPGGALRSAYLVDIVRKIKLKETASILEIGCNSGRNLLYLWNAGYHNLSGIEINRDAVELMRERLPEVEAQVAVGKVEEMLKQSSEHHLIFTMAVLVHLHPLSEKVFEEMVSKTKKYIITIEDEKTDGVRHYARGYQDVFEKLGMRQTYWQTGLPGLNQCYFARVFVKAKTGV